MQAAYIQEFGDLSNVMVKDVPKPGIKPGECLVRVLAAAINPSDVKNAQGGMADHTTLPRILGRDFAGVVEEGPEEWRGKEVFGTGGDLGFSREGSHAEHLALPAAALAPKPKNLTMAQAAVIGTPFVTAWSAVMDRGQLKRGERAAIWGAAGSVGSAACQIAKLQAAYVVGLIREGEKPEFADEAVWKPETVREIDFVLNLIGGETIGTSLAMLRSRGRMVVIASTKDRTQCLDILDFYRADLSLLGLNTLSLSAEACAKILTGLADSFDRGSLQVPKFEEMPLEKAQEAYRTMSNGTGAKVVLIPNTP